MRTAWEWFEWRQSFGKKQSSLNRSGIHEAFHLASREERKLHGTEKDFQDFETYRQECRASLTNEQWLWLAQIDSVFCILTHGPRKRDPMEYVEARNWVESLSRRVGSFEWVCEQFKDYDADALREALLAIVPSGGRKYATRPSSGASPRPAVSTLTPPRKKRIGYNQVQGRAA